VNSLSKILRFLVEIYSYLFHAVLSLFLLGIAMVAYIDGSSTFNIDMLPWEAPTLVRVLLLGNVIGLITLVLAITGKFRLLFPLWAAVVMYYVVKGVFFLKVYSGVEEFQAALLFAFGAIGAFLGAMSQARRTFQRKRR
jgi:hypothetical protein